MHSSAAKVANLLIYAMISTRYFLVQGFRRVAFSDRNWLLPPVFAVSTTILEEGIVMKRIPIFGIAALVLVIAGLIGTAFVGAQESDERRIPDSAASPRPEDVPLLVDDFSYPVGALLTANGWNAHSGAG